MKREELKGKDILVVGLGRSGRAAAEALVKEGARVSVTDSKTREELGYKDIPGVKAYLGEQPAGNDFDLAVVSPGVPADNPALKGVRVIGELELAYILCRGRFIAITGTNGKTTTTSLVGEIFKSCREHTYVVGNIGVPVVSRAAEAEEDAWMITECSSFQLETIDTFHPRVSAILNLTPEHLNRHGTMEEYLRCKARIFENQDENDFLVVNYEDEAVMEAAGNSRAKVIGFSRLREPEGGAYLKEDRIVVDGHVICDRGDIRVIGDHNVENVLAAAAICYYAGIDPQTIGKGISGFAGVEHRIEFAGEFGGVAYYNDSKGTNTDAAVTAIRALKEDIILLAGGDAKKQDFTSLAKALPPAVKHVVLYGRDRGDIKAALIREGYTSYTEVENLEEAVAAAADIARQGDKVLLSPACASWDSYNNFEERGRHFKELAGRLG